MFEQELSELMEQIEKMSAMIKEDYRNLNEGIQIKNAEIIKIVLSLCIIEYFPFFCTENFTFPGKTSILLVTFLKGGGKDAFKTSSGGKSLRGALRQK